MIAISWYSSSKSTTISSMASPKWISNYASSGTRCIGNNLMKFSRARAHVTNPSYLVRKTDSQFNCLPRPSLFLFELRSIGLTTGTTTAVTAMNTCGSRSILLRLFPSPGDHSCKQKSVEEHTRCSYHPALIKPAGKTAEMCINGQRPFRPERRQFIRC